MCDNPTCCHWRRHVGHRTGVLALVDRREGGQENIERRGHQMVSCFNRADMLRTSTNDVGHA